MHLVVTDPSGKELPQGNLFRTKFEAPAYGTYRVIVHTGAVANGAPFNADYSLSIHSE